MVEIPLILKLKKKLHKDIASAQDIIIKETYKVFNKAVLHGGTSIWRCYKGNRFSENIDLYIPRDKERINSLFKNFEKNGFVIKKKKIGKNSLYSKLILGRTTVRFEALFKKCPEKILKEYSTLDGNLITVYTLSEQELIKEKINAYLGRSKVRDIYDVYFLIRYVEDKKTISKELKILTRNFKEPVDKNELKILIIEGLIPSVDDMLEYIKRTIK